MFDFFVHNLLKIYFLFFLVVTVVSFVRTFLPPHRIRKLLMGQRFATGNILAALLGAITPFCSCSSIPFFIGLMEAEVPLGIAFSFLVASPLVNEVVFVLMGGTFGWKVAFIYALSGIILAVFAGLLIGWMKLEKEVIMKVDEAKLKSLLKKTVYKNMGERVRFSLRRAYLVFKNIWWVIVIGVGIGALIHGYVPEAFFSRVLGSDSIFAVPVAVVAGVPVYARSATIVPIIFAMTTKGVQLGTALAFMMATAGLSLPEAIMLRKVISTKLLAIFFGLVAVGIIIMGYVFNLMVFS
jgi:uncharacterized membrane protein YraQ (UPF0718 family)